MALLLAALVVWPGSARALSNKGYKALHQFTKILNYVEENYASEIDEEALIEGGIRGMLETLDPHSVYMSPEIYRELKVDTRGRFDGIGIEVTVRDGLLTVVAPIKGSPADRAGIQAGDRILKINGVSTKRMNLGEAVSHMRGRRGSHVTLTLGREGRRTPFDLTIVRRVIKVPSVSARLIDDRFAYVNIINFQQGTARAVDKALKRLGKQHEIEGLILDLRHNPGGLLEQAVAVSDLFLSDGLIVSTKNRDREIDRHVARSQGSEPDYPIVVLVDGGTASASEIVAGALQDQGRALVMGTTSFGKGSVQTVIDLGDGAALKLTIAHYFTPSGRLIHERGIEPDVVVSAKAPKEEKDKVEGGAEEKPAAPRTDRQLDEAIDYLREGKVVPRVRPTTAALDAAGRDGKTEPMNTSPEGGRR